LQRWNFSASKSEIFEKITPDTSNPLAFGISSKRLKENDSTDRLPSSPVIPLSSIQLPAVDNGLLREKNHAAASSTVNIASSFAGVY
jgi:hypothetical protein